MTTPDSSANDSITSHPLTQDKTWQKLYKNIEQRQASTEYGVYSASYQAVKEKTKEGGG